MCRYVHPVPNRCQLRRSVLHSSVTVSSRVGSCKVHHALSSKREHHVHISVLLRHKLDDTFPASFQQGRVSGAVKTCQPYSCTCTHVHWPSPPCGMPMQCMPTLTSSAYRPVISSRCAGRDVTSLPLSGMPVDAPYPEKSEHSAPRPVA